MQLTILGTSAMVPTKARNHSAALLVHNGEGILVDCGEGTQRQLKAAGISQAKITRICISHWHGDHVLGLPGLLMTISQGGYSGTLNIYGPRGTKQKFAAMLNTFVFDMRMKVVVNEVIKGLAFETDELSVSAQPLEHGISCLGWRVEEKERRRIHLKAAKELGIPEGPLMGKLQRGEEVTVKGKTISPRDVTYIVKGKTVAFITDTAPCENAHILAENADLLICEASYGSDLEEKAEEHTHMTAAQAAKLAKQADVAKLVITHFSARYANVKPLLQEARAVFKETTAAEDLMHLDV